MDERCEICDKTNHPTSKCFKNPKNVKRDNEGKSEGNFKKKNVHKLEKKSDTTEDNDDSESQTDDHDISQINTLRIKKQSQHGGGCLV